MKYILPFLLALVLLSFYSCEAIGDIFQAGVGVGIFIVIAIAVIIFWAVMKIRK